MRSTGCGTCVGCGKGYGVGDEVETDGMDNMGHICQRWRILHAPCRALLSDPASEEGRRE